MDAPDVWYIKDTVALFGAIPDADLAPLQSLLTRTYHRPDDVITLPSERERHVYFVKEGRVRLAQLGPDGRELTLDYLEQGEIFGALVFGDQPCQVYAVAATDAAVCKIPREHFEAFITHRPEVLFEVTKVLGDRLARMQVRIHDLLFLDVRGRILHSLRYLACTYGEPSGDGVRLSLRLTHVDLARLVGASRETVSQAVSGLRAEGLLAFDDRHPILPKG